MGSGLPAIAARLFAERVQHETTPSPQVRDRRNPLFPIGATLALTRRLRAAAA